MILILDNYDSFTYNLSHQIQMLTKEEVFVIKNDKIDLDQIIKLSPSAIVISPGPGNPKNIRDFGVCNLAIEYFHSKIPILGVCLGHQGIGAMFGGEINIAKYILHGKTSKIEHNGEFIFKYCKPTFTGMRYHSLLVENLNNSELKILATTKDNEIMAIKHIKYHVYGLQFHPESFFTEEGNQIISNFLKLLS